MKFSLLPQKRDSGGTVTARLLIIDNDEQILKVFSLFFAEHGYTISCAKTLAEAETMLESESFDIVIQDVNLPDGNGIKFLARIKELRPGTPVIIFTGFGYCESKFQEALTNGAVSYVSKGLPMTQILMEVRHALTSGSKFEPVASTES